LLLSGHICEVDLLDDPLLPRELFLDKVGPAIGSTSKEFYSFVDIGLTFVLAIFRVVHSIYIVMYIFHFDAKLSLPQHSLSHK
jgi:hypothetical protein